MASTMATMTRQTLGRPQPIRADILLGLRLPVQPDGLFGACYHGHDDEAEQVECVDGEERAEGDIKPHDDAGRDGRCESGGEGESGGVALASRGSRKKRGNRVDRSAG